MIKTVNKVFKTAEDKEIYDDTAIRWVEYKGMGGELSLEEFAKDQGVELKYETGATFMTSENYGSKNPSTLNGKAGEKEIKKMEEKKESHDKVVKSNIEKGANYSMKDLRAMAKEKGINSFGMKKEELEKAISN